MMRILSQMMKLPVTAFVYSMEMLVRTLQGVQKLADQGLDAIFGDPSSSSGDGSGAGSDLTNNAMGSGITQTLGAAPGSRSNLTSDTATSLTSGTGGERVETTLKEARTMRDTDLSDHKKLKLVRYKILFIKRKYEVAFPEQEELIADDITDTGYTAWKVAQFIQSLKRTPVPLQWGGGDEEKDKPKYPPDPWYDPKKGEWMINTLPEDDKKFLRVYFEVLERYQREKLHYEEKHIDLLEEIRDRL
jgi:hypoxanthine phosphoribosyltransferase